MVDFDAILNGQIISIRQTDFKQMILSLLLLLYTLNTNKKIGQIFADVFDQKTSLLKLLNSILNQYCIKKIHVHNYNRAFEEVKEEFFKSKQEILEKN